MYLLLSSNNHAIINKQNFITSDSLYKVQCYIIL